MARSLRWKLLAWYTLMMCGLACVFAGLLFVNVRRASNREIDARLERNARRLANVVVPLGEGTFEVELAPVQVEGYRPGGDSSLHYAIWEADGKEVDVSDPSLDVPRPPEIGSRDRGEFRELTLRGPGETWVLVGQRVRRQREEIEELAATALGVGGVVLTLTLAGGWFFTSRALQPIERISRAATAVSASNLAERIDASRMETELAELAGTINDAFDRLQRAFEQQTRFTADASHELRTPLSVMLSQAELALSKPRSDGEYREMIDAMLRAAQRMRGVVEGLLTLARADSGQTGMRSETFDLATVVRETHRLIAPMAAERGIKVTETLPPTKVRGDRDRLAEAVANLLSNAVKYNRPGGRVDVTLSRTGDEVSLEVADTGPGIPVAAGEQIFERFFRVDKARSRAVDGSGLGLAIARWIVEAHGGTISWHNREPAGAVFVVKMKADSKSG